MKFQVSAPWDRIMELHPPQFIDQLSADHLHGNPSPPSVALSILLGAMRFDVLNEI